MKGASERGAKSVNIVVGQDRQSEFKNLANKYNNKLYKFDRINVISAGDRDPDGEGVSAMSASKLEKRLRMMTLIHLEVEYQEL